MEYVIVKTTIDTEKAAHTLAQKIIKERLGACVHIASIASVYAFNGKMYDESEYALEVKTTQKISRKLQDFIIKNHPYDIPEIVELPVTDGSGEYLNWIRDTVK